MKGRQVLNVVAGAAAIAALSGSVLAQQAGAVAGNAERAKTKVSMCIGCHGIPGYRNVYPMVYHVPMIAGQNAGYIVSQDGRRGSWGLSLSEILALANGAHPRIKSANIPLRQGGLMSDDVDYLANYK